MPAARVLNTAIPPNPSVGYLVMQLTGGGWATGSGALIDNQQILTCSHNLVTALTGAGPHPVATQVRFYRAFNTNSPATPPAGAYLTVKVGFYNNAYRNNGDREWDIAVCRLDAPIPAPAPPLQPLTYFTPTLTGVGIIHQDVNLTGYPGPRDGEMWLDRDEVFGVNLPTNTLIYTHDTWPGNSGSPIWEYHAGSDTTRLHAVHVSQPGDGLRRGVLMTQPILDWIAAARATATPAAAGFQLVGL